MSAKVTVACDHCGSLHKRWPSNCVGKKRMFCSAPCRRAAVQRDPKDQRSEDRERSRRYYQANRERMLERSREYREANSAAISDQRRSHYRENAERIKARMKARYDENPDLMRARRRAEHLRHADRDSRIMKQWRQRNPERVQELSAAHAALKRGASSSEPINRSEIIARDRSICHICGKRVSRAEIHLDHLVPLSKGGEHSARNLAVAHGRCNQSRHAGRLPAQLRLIG